MAKTKVHKEYPPVRCASDFIDIKHEPNNGGYDYKIHPCFKKWRVCANGDIYDDILRTHPIRPPSIESRDALNGSFKPTTPDSEIKIKMKTTNLLWNVGRVILELWGDVPKPKDTEVNTYVVKHKDGNDRNNNITNLEWGTLRENIEQKNKLKKPESESNIKFDKECNSYTIIFYIRGDQLSFGNFSLKEDAIVRRDLVKSFIKEERIDELLIQRNEWCKTSTIDIERKESNIKKWIELSKYLKDTEKWIDIYPRYFGFDGNIYNIESRERMSASDREDSVPFVTLMIDLIYDEEKKDCRNKSIRISVAEYMALVSMGPKPEGMIINHINGDQHDNRFENLQYIKKGTKRKQFEIDE